MDGDLIGDLHDEYAVLDALLEDCAPADWARATPAEGWSVEDTVRHLVVADRAVVAAVVDDVDPVQAGSGRVAPAEEHGTALLGAWRESRAAAAAALAGCEDRARVPWGGRRMSARSLAVARLMEVWAHGLDCFAALSRPARPTHRLRHIAWLGHRTLPHAFTLARTDPPADPRELRVELTSPDGTRVWEFGPSGSRHRITGPALDWCRLATHRLRPGDPCRLSAEGPLAGAALAHARAFL